MSHNLRSGDPLQPRSPDYGRRRSRSPSPIKVPEIVTDGLEYHTSKEVFSFPPDFNPGREGSRVRTLNEALLVSYASLRDTFNELNRTTALLRLNKDRLWKHQVDALSKDVNDAVKQYKIAKHNTRSLIGEIDALEGSSAYYWAPRWCKIVGTNKEWKRVESGSLSHLSKEPHYVKYDEPDNLVFEGKGGKMNLAQKDNFDKVAFAINRVRYHEEVDCEDEELSGLVANLNKQMGLVIKCAAYGTLRFPHNLRLEVARINTAEEERQRKKKERQDKKKEEEKRQREKKKMEEDKLQQTQKGKGKVIWEKPKSIFDSSSSDETVEVRQVKHVRLVKRVRQTSPAQEEDSVEVRQVKQVRQTSPAQEEDSNDIATRLAIRQEQIYKDLLEREEAAIHAEPSILDNTYLEKRKELREKKKELREKKRNLQEAESVKKRKQ